MSCTINTKKQSWIKQKLFYNTIRLKLVFRILFTKKWSYNVNYRKDTKTGNFIITKTIELK